ncbi:MAG: hypothetical protein KF893_23295 [Caldilineaceae bacterium]|nr:hypothetical protein [Caldilineaceae bacterium]
MLTPSRLFVGFAVILAVVLTFLKIPLASSQGLTLVAAQLSQALPLTDPDSDLWQQATAVNVPLSAQMIARPFSPQTRIKSVTARALYNGEQVAFLVEWQDDTQNDQAIRVEDFRDGVALQFPLAEGQPFFCMGQQGSNVIIWHWKADWQSDIFAARQDMETAYPDMFVDYYPFTHASERVLAANELVADYLDTNYLTALAAGNLYASRLRATPVEDLLAGGFGTLTARGMNEQNVEGHGVWSDGAWRVIFSRSLTSMLADDISFAGDKVYPVAFAAWDGANQERNGTKSTSQWISLQLGGPVQAASQAASAPSAAPTPSNSGLNLMIIFLAFLVLAVVVGGLIYFQLPE